ncbi:hypothetical protein DFP73DRAFT_507077 [Morchella snyderi]|nr:hypothetical protein DFP73DRAFT_507077 [Morchella snyderi]
MAPRSALLILGIQNEFLDPDIGRCIMAAPPRGSPSFVDNIKAFVPHFRANGGDVIWVRSEYQKPRDFIDPRSNETVLIIPDDDSSDSETEHNNHRSRGNEAGGSGAGAGTAAAGARPRAGSSPRPRLANGARPPLRSDAFLAIESQHPPCKPGTPACEFHPSIVSSIKSPPDKIIVKTWFSAFKDTGLLETLRGRFVSELYICGVLTNICVLATAAEAAKHGLTTHVLRDCLGYRNLTAHQESLNVMVHDYVVEEVSSGSLVKSWERRRLKAGGNGGNNDNGSAAGIQLGATSLSKEQLVAMVSGLKVVGGERSGESTKKAPAEPVKGVMAETAATPLDVDKSALTADLAPIHEEDDKILSLARSARKAKAEVGSSSSGNPRFDSKSPIMGEGDFLGEGDSSLVNNILPPALSKTAFDNLKKEVAWRTMYHRGGEVPRMVAVEGVVDSDGDERSFPIYRHPADESPPLLQFSPTVQLIVDCVQKVLNHPVNHVLIQHYRDGNDYISEHSDKTLDIVRGSKIVNVSLGAQRTMILRTKKDAAKQKAAESTSQEQSNRPEGHGPERTTQRIPLPHNSMFILGLETNKKWLHGIRQDRRETGLKTVQEMSHNGERISLTFRHIGTFLSDKEKEIWGQGAVSKHKAERRPVVNGDDPETQRLIEAFGSENHQSGFDWDAAYGGGFDVLHFVPQLPKLFFTKGDIGSMQVRICLLEKGVVFTPYELEPNETSSPSFRVLSPRGTTPVFVDVDPEKTIVCEALSILQHIEMFHPSKDPEKFLLPSPADERAAFSRVLQHMQESEKLHKILESDNQAAIDTELEIWDARLFRTKRYLSGPDISLDDIAVWPVLDNYMKRTGLKHLTNFSELDIWYSLGKERDSVRVLSKEAVRDVVSETEGLENTMATLKLESEVKET